MLAHLGQQLFNLCLASCIGNRARRAGRGLQGVFKGDMGFLIAVFLVQELAIEEVWIDTVRVDLQSLMQQLLGLVGVAETEGLAGDLEIECAKAGTG